VFAFRIPLAVIEVRCLAVLRDLLRSLAKRRCVDKIPRHHLEIMMKSEMFVAGTHGCIRALVALVLVAGTCTTLAQTPTTSTDKSTPKGAPAAAQPSPMSPMPGMQGKPMMAGDMRGSMMGMMKSMESMQMTGDSDRDFATMMKMHHQGAIDMAQQELQSGKDPKMRAMAKRIIDAQKKEIKELEQWLGAHK